MHDNDPKHTARVCKYYLLHLEHSSGSKIMHWPPQSPDLYPIEKIWDELDRKIREMCPKMTYETNYKMHNTRNNRKTNKTDAEISRTNNLKNVVDISAKRKFNFLVQN